MSYIYLCTRRYFNLFGPRLSRRHALPGSCRPLSSQATCAVRCAQPRCACSATSKIRCYRLKLPLVYPVRLHCGIRLLHFYSSFLRSKNKAKQTSRDGGRYTGAARRILQGQFVHHMAEEPAVSAEHTAYNIVIPLAPSAFLEQGELLTRPDLGRQFAGPLFNPAGQCACWDLIIPALHLLQEASAIIGQLCQYHQQYFTRRLHLEQNHQCNCHYQPDLDRCLSCGYCHRCGCDLVTTSTPHFHRCTCTYCLPRCCPHIPTLRSAQQARLRHNLLRNLQATERCPPGTTVVTRYAPQPPLPFAVIKELRRLDETIPPLPLGRGYLTVDRCPVNSRWPTSVGHATTQNRGITGFSKYDKRPTTNRRSPRSPRSSTETTSTATTSTPQLVLPEPLISPTSLQCSCTTPTPSLQQVITPPSWTPTSVAVKALPEDDW